MQFGGGPIPSGQTVLRKMTARTKYYFNSPIVINAMNAATRKAMMKSAARIRKIAQRSMRYTTESSYQSSQMQSGQRKRFRKQKRSKPGEPPMAVRPHPWIRRHLDFAFDPLTKTAVIGPVPFPPGRQAVTPRKLEKGGVIARHRNPRRTIRRLGGTGELRIGGKPSRTTKWAEGKRVTYGRLNTIAQRDRANRINQQLYGPLYIGGRPLAPRPYMHPALVLEAPNLARRLNNSLWAHSVQ